MRKSVHHRENQGFFYTIAVRVSAGTLAVAFLIKLFCLSSSSRMKVNCARHHRALHPSKRRGALCGSSHQAGWGLRRGQQKDHRLAPRPATGAQNSQVGACCTCPPSCKLISGVPHARLHSVSEALSTHGPIILTPQQKSLAIHHQLST